MEGWAHYTEQMMIDEGYGRTRAFRKRKTFLTSSCGLGQLQDALLRNARYVVAIRMHTGEMTMEEANAYSLRKRAVRPGRMPFAK